MTVFFIHKAPWRTTCGTLPRYAFLRDDLSPRETNYIEIACGERPANPCFHYLCDAGTAFELLRARVGTAKVAHEIMLEARERYCFDTLRDFEIFLRERDAPRYGPLVIGS